MLRRLLREPSLPFDNTDNLFSSKILHIVGARPNFLRRRRLGKCVSGASANPWFQRASTTTRACRRSSSTIGDAATGLQLRGRLRDPRPANSRDYDPLRRGDPPGKLDWLVVYGDCNSTIATALVAVKMGSGGLVEAGLRVGYRTMPRNQPSAHNAIADILFVSEPSAKRLASVRG